MMDTIGKAIMNMSAGEIDDVLQAALRRKQELHPEWELVLLSLHRSGPERERDKKEILDFLRIHDRL